VGGDVVGSGVGGAVVGQVSTPHPQVTVSKHTLVLVVKYPDLLCQLQ
jgi:hypothetical protein